MKKKIILTITVLTMLLTGIFMPASYTAEAKTRVKKTTAVKKSDELHGVWVSCFDFNALGLYNKNEKTFRINYNRFLNRAKADHINAVFFHVRSYDDAVWKSSTFAASKYLTSKASRKKSARRTYTYDPLRIIVQMTHSKGMKIHAWMNPYRKTTDLYYNPGYASSAYRVVRAVNEVMAYKVDGIHFDDYFYSATRGYVNLNNRNLLKPSHKPSYSKRMQYVNFMVRRAYAAAKKKNPRALVGISPAGNMQNAKNLGCDINTWMGRKGYIDYIMPQIYWTDWWGRSGKVKMFSQRLNQWTSKSLNKASVRVYIGLASYRTGVKAYDDKGWGRKNNNLALQLNALRKSRCKGYCLFSARDLYRRGARAEIANLNKAI